MADTLKKVCNGELGTTKVTLYTVPASTTTIIKSIILANKTSIDITATITFAGTNIIPAHTIPANDSIVVQMTAIIETGDLIEGLSDTEASIDYYISGIEVN